MKKKPRRRRSVRTAVKAIHRSHPSPLIDSQKDNNGSYVFEHVELIK